MRNAPKITELVGSTILSIAVEKIDPYQRGSVPRYVITFDNGLIAYVNTDNISHDGDLHHYFECDVAAR